MIERCMSLAGRWAIAVARPGYYTNRPNFDGCVGPKPKALAWRPGLSSSGDRRGDSLGSVRRAVHGVGTHKSVDGAETLGVEGLNLPRNKDKHRANLYSQRVQQAMHKKQIKRSRRFLMAWSAGTRR